ncbi:hypothetical protein [Cytobacillus praedii]|uniref:hypothetical protein n=1 Tax=Cytobacillus praedii TaxID=1742358 RepID=UPI002E1D6A28|nr:hypothetical protein [Cytobacillus praedii]
MEKWPVNEAKWPINYCKWPIKWKFGLLPNHSKAKLRSPIELIGDRKKCNFHREM